MFPLSFHLPEQNFMLMPGNSQESHQYSGQPTSLRNLRQNSQHGHDNSIQQFGSYSNDDALYIPTNCQFCGKETPTDVLYQKHMNTYHRDAKVLPFTCHLCGMGFIIKWTLVRHLKVHDDAEYSCVVCTAKFKHQKNVKRHVETIHQLKQCRYCREYYSYVDDQFRQHVLACQKAN